MKINQDIVAVSFIGGNLTLLILPKLITGLLYNGLLLLVVLLWMATSYLDKRVVWLDALLFLMIGLLWSSKIADQRVTNMAPLVDKSLNVVAVVETLTTFTPSMSKVKSVQHRSTRCIRFLMTKVNGKPVRHPIPIEVAWHHLDKPIYAGQRWALSLLTRAIHSRLNEGSFDAQRFSISKHTLLRGIVKDAKILSKACNLRQSIVLNLINKINHLSQTDMIIALLFGERQEINKDKKRALLASGIAHLMAISGLHIMLIAGLGIRVSQLLQGILPVHRISTTSPLIISFVLVLAYVWLSGANPPALRAMMAFGGVILLRCKGIELGKMQLGLRLVALLILFDPLIVLSDSFWLSCLAAFSLLFLYHWLPLPASIKQLWWSPLIQLVHLQIGILSLLLPIQVWLFNGISVGGLITNLIAVPLMSLLIMPMLMVGLLLFSLQLGMAASTLYWLANGLLDSIVWFAELTTPYWYVTSSQWGYAAFIGWASIVFWRTQLWRRFPLTLLVVAMVMILPFFVKTRYSWRLDMLDVGHGLAVVISQNNSAIIYDTGQHYPTSSEAEKQIIPFLNWRHLTPELIILSHQHTDHSGGLPTLRSAYPNAKLMSSSSRLPNDFACRSGVKWRWKNLDFEVIWPPHLVDYADNDDSCVIRITDGKFSVLLTGDLEKNQELKLVAQKRVTKHTVLQVPHHGSNTSSSYAFLAGVNPMLAINSTSRYNAWRLPSKKVLSRYDQLHIPVLTTREHGQITLYFYDTHWRYATYRTQIKPRWYHDWFGALRKYG